LMDVGNGTFLQVLDFFNLGQRTMVVSTPDPLSMRCSFRFVKNSIYRKIQRQFGQRPDVADALNGMLCAGSSQASTMSDFLAQLSPSDDVAVMLGERRPLLILNMVASEQDRRLGEIIQSAVKKFLNVDMPICGQVPFAVSVRKTSYPPAAFDDDTASEASQEIRKMVLDLDEQSAIAGTVDPQEIAGKADVMAAPPVMGLNDNLNLMGKELHVQTEDVGAGEHCITTQVFCEGRVILSTKAAYPPALRDSLQSERLTELMRTQHFSVIRQIENRKSKHLSTSA